jgi:hypothetical protein
MESLLDYASLCSAFVPVVKGPWLMFHSRVWNGPEKHGIT